MRRNLKTAGGEGLVNIENEFLAKDIMYNASTELTKNPAHIVKSSDATAFRRSLVFQNGVPSREQSSSPQMMQARP